MKPGAKSTNNTNYADPDKRKHCQHHTMRPGGDEFIKPGSEINPNAIKHNQQHRKYTEDTEAAKEGANKRGNSSRLTQSFHFFMFEPIFSPVNALNQPI
ncbi:TPA: hypothetical protein F6V56_13485 [Escherichia coli]|nr:hypothetical protein [Escherichia coli]